MPLDLVGYQSEAGPQLLAQGHNEGVQRVRGVPQIRIDVGHLVLAIRHEDGLVELHD